MEFVLNENIPISDEVIINDIARVGKELQGTYLSISLYKKYGKYSQCAIQNHFGSWKNALALAGLRNERNEEDRKIIKDNEYLEDLKKVASIVNRETVTLNEYEQYGKYPSGSFFNRFKTWDNALLLAELQPTGLSLKRIDEQECYDEIERMWRLLGKQPTTTDCKKLSKYSVDTYKRRFGSWHKALASFVQYINEFKDDDIKNTSDSIDSHQDNFFDVDGRVEKQEEQKQPTIRRTSRNINTRLRFKVLQRDNFKCCACGASPAKDPSVVLHVDHIIPWSKGGETILENLQTLCSKCNLGKSDLIIE